MGTPLALKQTVSKQVKRWKRPLVALLMSGLLSFNLMGCADRSQRIRLVELPEISAVQESRRLSGTVSEVAPPAVLLDLDELMSSYQPRVTIVSPKSEQVIDEDHIEVKIKLKDFSIYKDEKLKLGPHLQVILDQQPARSVYSLEDPVTFEDLTPGSHTLQVVAVRPWGESFKTEKAIAQTTFHVLAATGENTPDPNQPSLTYLEPQGTYSAEPVLLDFHLTNAPLHQIAQESDQDDITDWQIRCTINGQSFVLDEWQPIYIKGLTPGQNWVQMSLTDRKGNTIKNTFNSTVRTFNYAPEKRDALAKIVRGELPLEEVGQIAIANYAPPAPPPVPVVVEPEPVSTVEPLTVEPLNEVDSQSEAPPLTESAEPADSPADNKEDSQESDDSLSPVAPTDESNVPNANAEMGDTDIEVEVEPTTLSQPGTSNAADIDTLNEASEFVTDDIEDNTEKTLEPEAGIFSQLRERVNNVFGKQPSLENQLTTPPIAPPEESSVNSETVPEAEVTEEQAKSESFQLDGADLLDDPALLNNSDVDSTSDAETELPSEPSNNRDPKNDSDLEAEVESGAILTEPIPPTRPDTLGAPEPPEVFPENNLSEPAE